MYEGCLAISFSIWLTGISQNLIPNLSIRKTNSISIKVPLAVVRLTNFFPILVLNAFKQSTSLKCVPNRILTSTVWILETRILIKGRSTLLSL